MANVFLVAGGTGNWNSTTNWSVSSGGASGAAFPVAGDVVAFDSASANANMTVNVASACASLVMSGTYAGTLTFTNTLTLTSTFTLVSTCTIAGTSTLILNTGGQTVTVAGKTLTCSVTFGAVATYTITGDLTTSGTLAFAGAQTIAGTGALTSTGPVTITGASTLTLNNTGGLTTTGTMTLPDAAVTFAGTAGWTVGTLTTAALTASRIYTLTFGRTYVVTAALTLRATPTVRVAIVSGTPGSKVIFTARPAVVESLAYVDPTDVNSSGGSPILSVGGTITTSTNWISTVAGGSIAPAGRVFRIAI